MMEQEPQSTEDNKKIKDEGMEISENFEEGEYTARD